MSTSSCWQQPSRAAQPLGHCLKLSGSSKAANAESLQAHQSLYPSRMQNCHLAGAVAAVQALSHASLGKEEKEGCMNLAQDMLKDCRSILSVVCARADAPPAKQLQPFQKHLHSTVSVHAGIPIVSVVVDLSPPTD